MKIDLTLPGSPPRESIVNIGENILERIADDLKTALGGRAVFWVWDETVWSLWGRLATDLGWPGQEDKRVVLFTASEINKRFSSVELLARRLIGGGAARDSAIVAVGGGVTGDVAGFTASIYMRGIPHFQSRPHCLPRSTAASAARREWICPKAKILLELFTSRKWCGWIRDF